jgi:hypothetical protein
MVMGTLKPIAEGVWGHDGAVTVSPGMRMPARGTIVRLADGGLLLHSPLRIDDDVASEIDALGVVRLIVAPSCLHWTFVKSALERYPGARVLGAPGLDSKLTAKAKVAFEALPTRGGLDPAGSLEVELVGGAPSLNEHAFFHAPSRTLLVSDLIFNVNEGESFGMGLVLRVVGAHHRVAQSRMWRLLAKDRAAAAESASRILGWQFDRVVVAHGDVIADDAHERARVALSWMTRGAEPNAA